MFTRTASPGYLMPVPARARRCAAAVALLLLALAVAACGPEPTPTPTPTATPTPTPTPTATPTPLPPTPTPTPAPLPKVDPGETGEFTVTESTTGADVMALLSESEIACVSAEIDPEAAQALIGAPLLENLELLDAFPIECLATEKAVVLSIALLDAETGGLSAETKTCLGDLYTENPAMLSSEEQNTPEAAAFGIEYILCLTDEEADAMMMARMDNLTEEEAEALRSAGGGEGAVGFKPSVMRCVMEELGGVETYLAIISSDSSDPSEFLKLIAAFTACGVDMAEMGQ